mgnify:CR=1 FL=1|jgi:hypothetical protein
MKVTGRGKKFKRAVKALREAGHMADTHWVAQEADCSLSTVSQARKWLAGQEADCSLSTVGQARKWIANQDRVPTEGVKFDTGKAAYELLAPEFLEGVANVLTFGAKKYSARNWELGMSWGRCFGACMRHMWAWWGGEKLDPESGLPHLHHAACCIMFLIAYEERKVGENDRK